MTTIKKTPYTLKDLESHITESHLDYEGGYPYGSKWIGSDFVVAEETHKGTHLEIYDLERFYFKQKTAYEMRSAVIGVDGFDDCLIFMETKI